MSAIDSATPTTHWTHSVNGVVVFKAAPTGDSPLTFDGEGFRGWGEAFGSPKPLKCRSPQIESASHKLAAERQCPTLYPRLPSMPAPPDPSPRSWSKDTPYGQ